MTKAKKKMTKSTFVIIIMAVAMVAMLAFGGTFAYFTATATDRSGSAKTGYVKLSSNDAFAKIVKENIMPGDTILAANEMTLTVDTTDDEGNYVAVKFVITAVKSDGTTSIPTATLTSYGVTADSILAADGNGWYAAGGDGNDGIYIWGSATGEPVAVVPDEGETTKEITINTEAFTLSTDVDDNWTQNEGGTLNAESDNGLMGATITFTLQAVSIQVANLEPADALTELTTKLNTPDGP